MVSKNKNSVQNSAPQYLKIPMSEATKYSITYLRQGLLVTERLSTAVTNATGYIGETGLLTGDISKKDKPIGRISSFIIDLQRAKDELHSKEITEVVIQQALERKTIVISIRNTLRKMNCDGHVNAQWFTNNLSHKKAALAEARRIISPRTKAEIAKFSEDLLKEPEHLGSMPLEQLFELRQLIRTIPGIGHTTSRILLKTAPNSMREFLQSDIKNMLSRGIYIKKAAKIFVGLQGVRSLIRQEKSIKK